MFKRLISLILVFVLALSLVPQVRAEENFHRVYGENRFETAFAIADQMKQTLGVRKFNAVIVACGSNFADALAGSYLASVCGAPILLAHNTKYNALAKDYIRANLEPGHTVYILGGEKAVAKDMEQNLEGFRVVRLAGENRFETNLEILREAGVSEGSEILVATGSNFADCLSGSATGKPILLVHKKLSDSQKAYLSQLKNCKFCIIGGTNAVSSDLEAQLGAYGITERIGGSNRFDTSVKVAQRFFTTPTTAVLAYAMNFPDGLCGGPLAYSLSAPLILTATKYEKQAADYAATTCIGSGMVLGGEGLISDGSCQDIFVGSHAWGNWATTLEPTAEHEGEESRSCSRCGATETRPLEKLTAPTEATPTEPAPTQPQPTQPVVKPEIVPTGTLPDCRIVIDGVVRVCDIYVAEGNWYLRASDAEKVFGGNYEENYIGLHEYAQAADIAYEQDTVLNAAYFHSFETYYGASRLDFSRAFSLGLADNSYKSKENQTITSAQYRTMLADLIETYAPQEMPFFDKMVTRVDVPMTRGMGFIMAYYAGICLDQNLYNNPFTDTHTDSDEFWSFDFDAHRNLFPHAEDGPVVCNFAWSEPGQSDVWNNYMVAGFLWSHYRCSPLTGNLMFTFDHHNGSMHQGAPLTVFEAVSTLTRMYDSFLEWETVEISDNKVSLPSDQVIALLDDAAKRAPEVTADDHPIWSGMILAGDSADSLEVVPNDLQCLADWGFNTTRINLDYRAVFDRNATTANTRALYLLDEAVATAIQNNVHLNICFTAVPGRAANVDVESSNFSGEFDLFINPEQQIKADRMYAVLAQRYKNVPSAYLTFTPLWEANNNNLSTGQSAPEYTGDDIGKYLAHAINLIHGIDPDRLIIAENCSNGSMDYINDSGVTVYSHIKDLENVVVSNNFGLEAYIYAGMTATQGLHIDHNNKGVPIPSYPNTIYDVRNFIDGFTSLTLNGFLPAGTKIDVYVDNSWGSGELQITQGSKILASDTLGEAYYNRSEYLSGFFPYATSDKCLSITLTEKADSLRIGTVGGLGLILCGIDVYLPEEYAVERWYHATRYDVMMGWAEKAGPYRASSSRIMLCPSSGNSGDVVTIHEDTSYVSNTVWITANKQDMINVMDALSAITDDWLIRIESAEFSGTTWESMADYYTDFFDLCADRGYGWLSCDWRNLMFPSVQEEMIALCPPCIPYRGYESVHIELLKLMQAYQTHT